MRVLNKTLRLHRSIRTVPVTRIHLISLVLLPAAFTFFLWLSLQALTNWWQGFFDFWLPRLGLPCETCLVRHGPGWLGLYWPHIRLTGLAFVHEQWQAVLAITTLTMIASYFLSDRFLPLRIYLRVAVFIQVTALLVFFIRPDYIATNVNHHIETIMVFSVILLLIVPWLYAFTYYVLDISMQQIVALTVVTWIYLLIFTPMFALFHAFLIIKVSVLLMPVLYFLFGVNVPLMACIAFYGWGLSRAASHRR